MKTNVLALHGDYANGDVLKRDMGNPGWVDEYITWKTPESAMVQISQRLTRQPAILVGYSRGAEIVRRMANVRGVVAVVGYEPLAERCFASNCSIPKLLIVNNFGRQAWSYTGELSAARWLAAGAEHILGRGFHVRVRFGWPLIGHAWDKQVNGKVEKWIENVKQKGR